MIVWLSTSIDPYHESSPRSLSIYNDKVINCWKKTDLIIVIMLTTLNSLQNFFKIISSLVCSHPDTFFWASRSIAFSGSFSVSKFLDKKLSPNETQEIPAQNMNKMSKVSWFLSPTIKNNEIAIPEISAARAVTEKYKEKAKVL